ncbi:MAG: hypothetical protein ABIX01_06945 [Chitinophagaceae bacterium]
MITKKLRRLTSKTLVNDRATFDALKDVAAYAPANNLYELKNISERYDRMTASQTKETQVAAAHKTATDDSIAAEHDFHGFVLSAKDQVIAQFGADSNEVQALGLKKKSDRKRPAAKKKAA